LQKQRLKLSSLVSQGGTKSDGGKKRMRTTRAALSALEGGSRSTTRAEKWFKADLNPHLVMKTAGEGWAGGLGLGSSDEGELPDGNPGVVMYGSSDVEPELQSSPPPSRPVKRRGRPPKKKVVEDESTDEGGGASA